MEWSVPLHVQSIDFVFFNINFLRIIRIQEEVEIRSRGDFENKHMSWQAMAWA